jgi:hypothetical protein
MLPLKCCNQVITLIGRSPPSLSPLLLSGRDATRGAIAHPVQNRCAPADVNFCRAGFDARFAFLMDGQNKRAADDGPSLNSRTSSPESNRGVEEVSR